jgi:hypothetical protein
MTTHPSIKSSRLLSLLGRTLLATFLISLIWLPGLFPNPALAVPIVAVPEKIASRMIVSSTEGNRMSNLITCLPQQLSQPSLKRALSEMGNDQLERAFNLKANPKLSQAEIDLASCLKNRLGS